MLHLLPPFPIWCTRMISQSKRALQLLLLWDEVSNTAGTVRQHVTALQTYSAHRVHPVPAFGVLPRGLQLERFDGIVLHYSLTACHDRYVSPAMRRAIAQFAGIKAMFIQDEYQHVDADDSRHAGDGHPRPLHVRPH